MASEFTLFQPQILSSLKSGKVLSDGTEVDGEALFMLSITKISEKIAFNQYGCDVTLNANNLRSAWRYWCRDVKNIELRVEQQIAETNEKPKSRTPNEAKQAAFLAYWLRRRLIVSDTRVSKQYTSDKMIQRQWRFRRDSSETLAFIIGLYLCIYYKLKPSDQYNANFSRVLSDAMPDQKYIFDVVNVFKNKNVSPDSVYMIYNSLFRDDPTAEIK